jgi:Kef-type K+ transport system membrane component KefB
MNLILDVILVLLFAKLIGGLLEEIKMVELLGAILAGILLGPVLGLVEASNIEPFGRIGLILILFLAGFEEFPIAEILKEKFGIMTTGFLGGVIPFICGFVLGKIFGMPVTESLFVGGVMAATSVSIAAATLISTRKVNTKAGRYVIAGSIIDDIVGLLILILIIGFVSAGKFEMATFYPVIAKVILFAVLFTALMVVVPKLFNLVFRSRTDELEISTALVIILSLAYFSEILGFSSIIGAFLGGVMLSRIPALKTRIETQKFEAIALGFFVPFFFAWVGLEMNINLGIIGWFTLAFILVAMISKIASAFISGLVTKMKPIEMLAIGLAGMPRGEVALSVLIIGKKLGVVPDVLFGATLLLIIVTIFVTPIVLRPVLAKIKA